MKRSLALSYGSDLLYWITKGVWDRCILFQVLTVQHQTVTARYAELPVCISSTFRPDNATGQSVQGPGSVRLQRPRRPLPRTRSRYSCPVSTLAIALNCSTTFPPPSYGMQDSLLLNSLFPEVGEESGGTLSVLE